MVFFSTVLAVFSASRTFCTSVVLGVAFPAIPLFLLVYPVHRHVILGLRAGCRNLGALLLGRELGETPLYSLVEA